MAVAVVTGAASGIGRALATRLAHEGYLVHLADIGPVEELASTLGGVPVHLDVSDPAGMDDLAASVPEADFVCLNAGVVGAQLGAPWDVPPDEWSRLVSVNVLGVVNGLRSFVPKLKESDRASHIIITASLAGLITFPGGGAYAATKHATVTVAEQAAMLLAGTNVSVTLLCPALVRTGMSATGEDPDAVARAALEAAHAGQFLVAPPEWTTAVVTRAEQLISGRVPGVPAPMPIAHDPSPRGSSRTQQLLVRGRPR